MYSYPYRTGLIGAIAAFGLAITSFTASAQELVIGAAGNAANLVPFVASSKGLFAKNGIDAKLVVVNTGSELSKGLRAGTIDFAPAAFTNLPAALERGLKVRGVIGYAGGTFLKTTSDRAVGIVAGAGSGIEKIADLKGKKIGVTFGTTGDLYLQQVLKAAGLSTADVDRVNTRPPSLTSVVDTGGVDAMVAWEPYIIRTLAKVPGSKLVIRGGDHVCFCAALHGNPEKVYGDEKQTQGIVDAMAEAAAFVRNPANREEVADIGSRCANMTKDELLESLQYLEVDPRIGPNRS